MRLRQIEVFHAIYSSGSMTNAAAMLNVSQPSISKVLSHAEQQLGYQLFERVKGKLVATPEAHQLYAHVTTVYKDVDRLRHIAANLKANSEGRIRVATTPALGLDIVPGAVARFRRQFPESLFELETLHLDEMTEALLESRVDIGFAFDSAAHPGIDETAIGRGRFFVLVPPDVDLGAKTSLSIRDIESFDFIGLNSRGPLGRMLSDCIGASGSKLEAVAWSETYHLARALVAKGVGVTIADEITARAALDDGVQSLPLEPELSFDINALHVGTSPLSVSAQRFIETFGERLAETLQP